MSRKTIELNPKVAPIVTEMYRLGIAVEAIGRVLQLRPAHIRLVMSRQKIEHPRLRPEIVYGNVLKAFLQIMLKQADETVPGLMDYLGVWLEFKSVFEHASVVAAEFECLTRPEMEGGNVNYAALLVAAFQTKKKPSVFLKLWKAYEYRVVDLVKTPGSPQELLKGFVAYCLPALREQCRPCWPSNACQYIDAVLKRDLSELRIFILRHRFGLGGAEKKSIAQMANERSVKQSTVRVQLALALKKIQEDRGLCELMRPIRLALKIPGCDPLTEVMLLSLDELDLSTRPYSCLRNNGVRSLGQLVVKTPPELLALRNFGKKSLEEIYQMLKKINDLYRVDLRLGMVVDVIAESTVS